MYGINKLFRGWLIEWISWGTFAVIIRRKLPEEEFINTINELASKAKFPNPVEDIRKVFDSQESRDFRNLLAQRRQKINQGIKLTEEEVQTMMKAYAKGIEPHSEQLKRICRKYTLIEL